MERGDAGGPVGPSGARVLDELVATIAARARERPPGSYTTKLLDEGVDRIGRKIGEEAAEVIIAAKNRSRDELAAEMADLWFHSLILLASRGLGPRDVWAELHRRRR